MFGVCNQKYNIQTILITLNDVIQNLCDVSFAFEQFILYLL